MIKLSDTFRLKVRLLYSIEFLFNGVALASSALPGAEVAERDGHFLSGTQWAAIIIPFTRLN